MTKMTESALNEWLEQHKVIEQLQAAIQSNTVNPPGNEILLAERIQSILLSYGIEAKLTIASGTSTRANLIATIRGANKGKTLVFSGHMDTVPIGENVWKVDPFSGELREGKLYGRGTADMKGGLYALLYSFIKCKMENKVTSGELIFAASFGEETGCEGAQEIVAEKRLPPFDAMIIAEPTDNQLFIAHKGVLWLRIEGIGKTAHSSMPDHGINAIMALHQFMNRLKTLDLTVADHPLLSPATLVVTTINGGLKANVVPDYGAMTIDLRTLPEHSHDQIYEDIVRIANEITNNGQGAVLKVSRLLDLPGLTTDASADIVTAIQLVFRENFDQTLVGKGINYFTDGSVFQACGDGHIVILGPGKPELAHQPDEYVEIASIAKSIHLYTQTVVEYLR
jgi:succinyl-diaminopimelate desuccinylase